MAMTEQFIDRTAEKVNAVLENGHKYVGFADVSALCGIAKDVIADGDIRRQAQSLLRNIPNNGQYDAEKVKPILKAVMNRGKDGGEGGESAQGQTADPTDSGEGEAQEAAETPFDSWTKPELLKALQARGVSANNQMRKEQLVERLRRAEEDRELTGNKIADAEERFAEQAEPEASVEIE